MHLHLVELVFLYIFQMHRNLIFYYIYLTFEFGKIGHAMNGAFKSSQ